MEHSRTRPGNIREGGKGGCWHVLNGSRDSKSDCGGKRACVPARAFLAPPDRASALAERLDGNTVLMPSYGLVLARIWSVLKGC